jgi:anti-sigma regulatory factor (Ser/Thr protein kinase)
MVQTPRNGHHEEVTPSSATLTLRPEPQSVSEARRLTRRVCDDASLSADLCDTAVLLTSETVTNAVIHAHSVVRLAVTIGPAAVRVEVGDDDSHRPTIRSQSPDAIGGRGVGIVAKAASRWGVERVGDGKIVWFELQR